MSLALQFSDQSFEISTDSGATYKPLVCLQTVNLSTELPTTDEDTNCGRYTGLGIASQTVAIDAVCEAEPTISQVTYEDVIGWLFNRTLVTWRYRNAASGSLTAGAAFYNQGTGYFVKADLTGQTGGVIKFAVEFKNIGTPDITP